MDCLSNIIGLSRTECECLTDQLPTGSDEISDYNESESGVFMDELPGFNVNVASGADDCAKGGIWERMNRARANAILDYKTHLLSCIGKTYKPRINNFSGLLGEPTFKGTSAFTTAYAGMKITPHQVKGAFIYIKRIGVIVNQSTNVNVKIYSNKNTYTELFSSTISSTADAVTYGTLATPLELPMWDDSGLRIKYFVLMELNGTFQPKKNKKSCCCGGSKNREPFLEWLSLDGVSGDDLDLIDSFNVNDKLNGIVVDADVKCKASEIICSSQYPMDFENDPNALSTAYAIRYRADAILYEDLLGSDNINRMTMMNREDMAKYATEWNDKFMQWIDYVCLNTNNMRENDCWICKEGKNDIIKRSIKVTK